MTAVCAIQRLMRFERAAIAVALVGMLCAVLSGCTVTTKPVNTAGVLSVSENPSCSVESFAQIYLQLREQPGSESLGALLQCHLAGLDDVQQAMRVQQNFVQLRGRDQGIAGYKIALGGKGAQRLFGLDKPVVGVLFDDTFLPDGATLAKSTALNLAFEPDLAVEIGDACINTATNIQQVARCIRRILPFIELPDLVVMPDVERGPAFIATNAAVHRGVLGEGIAASGSDEFIASLATMSVNLFDAEGQLLNAAEGGAIMGHPYQALLYLLETLRNSGTQLQVGDVVSLGAFAPPRLVGTYRGVTLNYTGLGGQAMSVSVNFSDR